MGSPETVTFEELLATLGLLALTYYLGRFADCLKCPALVVEILVGIVFGPRCADVLPRPDGYFIFGQLGLYLLLFIGGANLDLGFLREIGARAFLIALSGTLLPIGLAICAMTPVGIPVGEAAVMGTALSSTAAGMTVKLLQSTGMLVTCMGQIVLAASMIDDVCSLVILAAVNGVSEGESDELGFRVLKAVLPVIMSTIYCGIVTIMALRLPCWLQRLPKKCAKPDALILSMALAGAGLSALCNYGYSSPLLGSFLGGLLYSQMRTYITNQDELRSLGIQLETSPDSESRQGSNTASAHEVGRHVNIAEYLDGAWVTCLVDWLMRLFFIAVGCQVPLEALLEKETIGEGMLLIVAAVLGKLVCGAGYPGSTQERFTVGVAMVARGELGFVMGAESLEKGLITQRGFNAVVWALLIPTLVAPPIFTCLLGLSKTDHTGKADTNDVAAKDTSVQTAAKDDSAKVIDLPGAGEATLVLQEI